MKLKNKNKWRKRFKTKKIIKRMRIELDNRIKWNQMLANEIKIKIHLKKVKNKINNNQNNKK
jgi:hypothetical protein